MPREDLLPIAQTEATTRILLYDDSGAPGYSDVNPKNGIDDRRDTWLKQLSLRFAPWLVRNTVDFPLDFDRFITRGGSFPLFIDVFETSRAHPSLLRTESIDFAALE
jgi:hypothetical protein